MDGNKYSETPTPERMRAVLEKVADLLPREYDKKWSDRDVIHFIIGYYRINYESRVVDEQ